MKYTSLRFVAALYKFLGFMTALIDVVIFAGFIVYLIENRNDFSVQDANVMVTVPVYTTMAVFVIAFVIGLISALTLWARGAWLLVQIDIEYNTRRTAYLLERMMTQQRPSNAPNAPAPYVPRPSPAPQPATFQPPRVQQPRKTSP